MAGTGRPRGTAGHAGDDVEFDAICDSVRVQLSGPAVSTDAGAIVPVHGCGFKVCARARKQRGPQVSESGVR